MPHSLIQIISIAASIAIILFVISLIRKRKLREEYSILWLIGSVVLIVFSIWRRLVDIIADFVGVAYAPAILLLTGILFGVLMFLHFTVVISKQADENKTLAQEIALLKNRIDKLEKGNPE
jgi:hypothetical protein